MKQIRIYTLKNRKAAEIYFYTHWPRHLISLPKFGVYVNDVYLGENEQAHQVIAVGTYQEGSDLHNVNQLYLASEEFRADMEGFNMSDIIRVEEISIKESLF